MISGGSASGSLTASRTTSSVVTTAVSAELALRLARLFGSAPEFWLNLQCTVDLWDAERGMGREIQRIRP